MKRITAPLVFLAGTLGAGFAAAQPDAVSETETTTQSESKGYLSLLPYWLSVDSDRGLGGDGRGLAIAYGREWKDHLFWELQMFGDLMEAGRAGLKDQYRHGAGLDLGVRFTPRPGPTGYLVFGVGALRTDSPFEGTDDTDYYGNIGLGIMTGEIGRAGVRIRAEGRLFGDKYESNGHDGFSDWRIGLGVTVPLGRRTIEREVVRERVVTETERVTIEAEIVDSDNDGVPDQIDQCPGTLAGLATDNRGCVVAEGAQTLRLEGVNFELNSATLTPLARDILGEVADALLGEPNLRAEIAGHTDSSGADDYNLQLSQQRAEAVRAFLVSQGVEAGRLQARGYGEAQPISDNATETGRALNRRVEFRVLN